MDQKQQQLPSHMNVKQLSNYTEISKWQIMRLVDRFNLPFQFRGTSKMIEVAPALALLERLPGSPIKAWDYKQGLVDRLKAALEVQPADPVDAQ